MGPPDENLILGSDPAVLSSPSYPALGNSILHVSHQITASAQTLWWYLVYYNPECSTCTMLHLFNLEILI
jgi:hypothetical protein